ncbi:MULTISPECIES: SLC13 family permease [unclassified Leucobacter]|uniref:SLC13 family permease n=1 Tax=unclassified Leucobacter TaxID=2621730 RepID=UPI00165D9E90|nr:MULTISPECIES: SLC13 family permease [unclassified Leucobacter]MBC9935824.1 SLC13 family permease [Leucobacter sp. cx-87]
MDPIAITLTILVLAIVAFVSNRIPLGIVAVGVALALFFTGVLTLPEALAGFGDPTVLFIASLFIVSESLDATGVTAWAGQQVIARAGTKRLTLLIVISVLVAGLTALISVNGAVAALLPLVVVVAARAKIASSQLLLPLAFAAHAGSLLALTGTPVNIIVSEAAKEAGGRAFGYFEFALVGIPLVVCSVTFIALFGRRLLPERASKALPTDLHRLAATLRTQYAVEPGSDVPVGASHGFSEVVVAPRSPLIGMHVFPGMTTPSGDLVVLGARRGPERLEGAEVRLQAGDALLLQGDWDDLQRHTAGADVLVVDAPQRLRRSVPLGRGAKRAVGILLLMVVLLATGMMPAAAAAMLAASALVVSGAVSVTQAYRSISWTTVVLIAGMIPLSTAFQSTGAADLIAGWLMSGIGEASPYVALAAICALTIVLGQLISNTATVLIVLPVAIALAEAMGASVQPFLMALTVAGAASFLTPIATPANLMVMEPGGYRFGDYWKLGLPLALIFFAIAVFYVPLIWPF